MSAMTTAAVVGIAAGVNALTGGGVTQALGLSKDPAQQAKETAQAADPFSAYRGNLAAMYSGYLQPGASMDPKTMPGYSQFQTGVLDPAMEASKRSAAASGMSMSGKEQAALQDVGQRGYYGFMTDYMNRLAQGSGAAQNPAQAYGMGLNQANLQNMATMQGLGALSTGLAGYGKLNAATQTFDSTPQLNVPGEGTMSIPDYFNTAPVDSSSYSTFVST